MTKDEVQTAIDAHLNWKRHFSSAIAGKPVTVDLNSAANSGTCSLGRWLAGVSREDRGRLGEEYEKIVKLHDAFHKSAGQVVEAISSHDVERAKTLLREDYSANSSALSAALLNLKWNPSAAI